MTIIYIYFCLHVHVDVGAILSKIKQKSEEKQLMIAADEKNIVNTHDSQQFGMLSRGLILGKVSYIIWPPNRIRKITPDLTSVGGDARLQTNM